MDVALLVIHVFKKAMRFITWLNRENSYCSKQSFQIWWLIMGMKAMNNIKKMCWLNHMADSQVLILIPVILNFTLILIALFIIF